jgi:hypothetical protein
MATEEQKQQTTEFYITIERKRRYGKILQKMSRVIQKLLNFWRVRKTLQTLLERGQVKKIYCFNLFNNNPTNAAVIYHIMMVRFR